MCAMHTWLVSEIGGGVSLTFAQAGLESWSFYLCLLCSWDYSSLLPQAALRQVFKAQS
jgi:hypothetical protein